jgi:signal peptidase I
MNYLQRRRLKKNLKHLLHEARHARYMREDVEPAEAIAAVLEAEAALTKAWEARDMEALDKASEELSHRVEAIYPPQKHPRAREYIEILVVAVSVAMAFRTFFIQPFKIPTGSMEPTLYGIKVEAVSARTMWDRFPLSIGRFLVFGERYVEIKARRSGVIEQMMHNKEEGIIFSQNGLVPPFRDDFMRHFQVGDYVVKGQVLASGRIKSGDHIFVNKVRYNFTRPERGNIFVFSTDHVDYPGVKKDTFYIKRLVGLPGEAISIDPPYLVADGQRVLDPDVFDRQAHAREQGYMGYVIPQYHPTMKTPAIHRMNQAYQLASNEYLPMGDNTLHSLDGRYFGGVPQDNIVGPAFAVYWPISPRWGWVR